MPSGRPPIVDRLRAATRELHVAVEEASDVLEGGLARYVWFVERQYGFHAGIEPRLAEASGLEEVGLDLERRRRAHLLAADLVHFGRHPARVPRCTDLPRVATAAQVLGALYVLEGATLGGIFILHNLGRTLGIAPGAGANGIAPYGNAVREMWVAYADALDRFVRAHPDEEDAVVAAACETFEKLLAWMRLAVAEELAPVGPAA